MILRSWHGWTSPENADAYELLLREKILPDIMARELAGLGRVELLRRLSGHEVEFVTLMWFSSLDDVKAFAGERWEEAVVPPAARALLARFDQLSVHYELREQMLAG